MSSSANSTAERAFTRASRSIAKAQKLRDPPSPLSGCHSHGFRHPLGVLGQGSDQTGPSHGVGISGRHLDPLLYPRIREGGPAEVPPPERLCARTTLLTPGVAGVSAEGNLGPRDGGPCGFRSGFPSHYI